ncbi:MAG: hypothetical protein IPP47_19395 [Bryobacterales bacterium]|nr:hypothetical protein [Bryobacterales bacterium]
MTPNLSGRIVLPLFFSLALAAAVPLAPPKSGTVSVGFRHSLWLKPDGTVWAWGANSSGQLGDGTYTRRTAPVPVVGLTSVAAIATGDDWSIALRTDGTIWSWGANHHTASPYPASLPMPTPLPWGSGVIAIAASPSLNLALKADGTIWRWAGTGFPLMTGPVCAQVSGLIALAQGGMEGVGHSVFLHQDGTVWTSGRNAGGVLGDGTTTDRDQPAPVPGLTGVTAIGAGHSHTVALKADGTVWVWGGGTAGQLGDGAMNLARLTPKIVPGLSGIRRIGARENGTFAQALDGRVWDWGTFFYGEFGGGITRMAPVELPSLAGAFAIAEGVNHGTFLRPDGALMAWGNNAEGQLGAGTANIKLWPEVASATSGVAAVAAGTKYSTFVKNDGTVLEWGYTHNGSMLPVPNPMPGLLNVVGTAQGSIHSYALKSDGTVWSWGNDYAGSLGDGSSTYRPYPQVIAGLANIKAIASGDYFGVALSTSGAVWTWGLNQLGQLGDGTTANRWSPAPVPGLSGVKAIAVAGPNVLALKDDGTVCGWGQNRLGQLGDGTSAMRTLPVMAFGLANITAIAGSDETSLALGSDGTVWSWGGDHGLGIGYVPGQLTGISGVRAIWAGYQARFAQTTDGTMWAWGSNWYGNLGDGTGLDSANRIVRLSSLPLNIVSVSSSSGNNLAITASGQLYAWGYVPSAQWTLINVSSWPPQLVANTGAYTLGTTEIFATTTAGSQSVTLTTTTPSRPWVAARDSYWLSATPTNGANNTSLIVSWQQNLYPESRTGTIRLGGQAVTVTQAGTGASYKISGHVLLNGAGLQGVPIMLFGPQNPIQLTDRAGYYEFKTLSAGGAFGVAPIAPNLRFLPVGLVLVYLTDNQTVDFTAQQNATGFGVSRTSLAFASTPNGSVATPPQELTVTLTGTDPLLWNATSSKPWLSVSPGAGSSTGKLTVSLVPAALPKFGTDTAIITITAPNLPGGTATVTCTLTIAGVTTAPPYGSFDTPGPVLTGLSGGVAVTGWALDDIGVQSVKIWRDRIGSEQTYPNGLVYIGDALFVPGARPDVEAAHPTRPANYNAGWGYMMLSNALPKTTPSGTMGSGTYRLHAIATDVEGQSATIGTKTITVDNRGSSKPFGAVDAPAPGATIEGAAYPNSGWALTPQPDIIPIDGSTFGVYVDGVNLGKPVYNQFRPDVAGIFPGLANSAGSGGSYVLDTTKLTNGMHSIAWSVADDQGHIDGIGSRFFHILNSGSTAAIAAPMPQPSPMLRAIRGNRLSAETAGYRTGYDEQAPLVPLPADAIAVAELERIELHLPPSPEGAIWSAALRVGEEVRPLPIGSTFDPEAGVFYWQLGPGFLGDYIFEFRATPDAKSVRVRVRVGVGVDRVEQNRRSGPVPF